MQVREQYDLRRKKNIDNPKPKASEITIKKKPGKTPKVTVESSKLAPESSGKNKDKDILTSDKSSQGPSSTSIAANAPDKIASNIVHTENQQDEITNKTVPNKTELNLSKSQSAFNLESEIAKIKIYVPLIELAT